MYFQKPFLKNVSVRESDVQNQIESFYVISTDISVMSTWDLDRLVG